MKSIRLLPVVIFAVFALLTLKGIGLVTNGGYILTGTSTAVAQEDEEATESEFTPSDERAADRASETLFSRAERAPITTDQLDAVPVTQNNDGDKIAFSSPDGGNETERAVLERLSERRTELDNLGLELETRAALVEAAEKRLAERIVGLEAIEARITALVEERKALDDEQFRGLVGMYETMKPGDAAKIFDSLSMKVLERVARAMSPRKMAPVLAKMSTERARELTQRMAAVEPEPAMDTPLEVAGAAALPQIVGE